jgi:hypothetical protein
VSFPVRFPRAHFDLNVRSQIPHKVSDHTHVLGGNVSRRNNDIVQYLEVHAFSNDGITNALLAGICSRSLPANANTIVMLPLGLELEQH